MSMIYKLCNGFSFFFCSRQAVLLSYWQLDRALRLWMKSRTSPGQRMERHKKEYPFDPCTLKMCLHFPCSIFDSNSFEFNRQRRDHSLGAPTNYLKMAAIFLWNHQESSQILWMERWIGAGTRSVIAESHGGLVADPVCWGSKHNRQMNEIIWNLSNLSNLSNYQPWTTEATADCWSSNRDLEHLDQLDPLLESKPRDQHNIDPHVGNCSSANFQPSFSLPSRAPN